MELRLGEFGDKRLEKGGRFCRAPYRAWRQGCQRQAAGWRSRRRDADHAVFAQSQGAAQRDDVGGAGTHLRSGRRPPRARHSGYIGSARGRERRRPVVSSGHRGGRQCGNGAWAGRDLLSEAQGRGTRQGASNETLRKRTAAAGFGRGERQRPGRSRRGLRHGRRGSRRRHLRMLRLQAGRCGEAGARRSGSPPGRWNVAVLQGRRLGPKPAA